jgi:hypothetical protein
MVPSRGSKVVTANTIHTNNNKTIDMKATAIRAAMKETHNRTALGLSQNRQTAAITEIRKQGLRAATVRRDQ